MGKEVNLCPKEERRPNKKTNFWCSREEEDTFSSMNCNWLVGGARLADAVGWDAESDEDQ